jgi:hypothetical protein
LVSDITGRTQISVLRRIFERKRNEVIGGRKLHNEELHNFYPSSNIIRMIKSGKFSWAWHVARFWLGTGRHTGF